MVGPINQKGRVLLPRVEKLLRRDDEYRREKRGMDGLKRFGRKEEGDTRPRKNRHRRTALAFDGVIKPWEGWKGGAGGDDV